jgi:Na+/melibiose symporter-like transporter
MTKKTKEKVQLGSLRSVGSSVGAMAITSLVLPMVAYFGRGDAQRGFTITAALFAVAGTAMYGLVFFNTQERYVELMDLKPLPVWVSIRQVLKNEIFMVTGAFTLIHLVRIGSILTLTVYFSLMILKAPWAIPFLFGAMSIGSVVSASMATPFFNRFGFRKGNIYVLLFAFACYCVLPITDAHPAVFLIGFCLSCMGAQACTTAIFAMIANATDFHEFKFCSRCDGLIFSCFSLSTKVGIAMGASIIAFGLGIAHYNAQAITPHAVQAIRWMFYAVPMALMLLQILAVMFYGIDTKHTLIVRSSAARASAEIPEEPALSQPNKKVE